MGKYDLDYYASLIEKKCSLCGRKIHREWGDRDKEVLCIPCEEKRGEEIFREDGINWFHFAEMTVNEENSTVVVLRHYRKHKFDDKLNARESAARANSTCLNPWETRDGVKFYNHPLYGWLKATVLQNF